ncbi:hypothetical protein [Nigerium massiliense]|uniref:hypothetical protein n=1 Tax=Nigerium massiliense TaxID=1522317 RepID=UPI00058F39EC|nr:hypothetical protein [Nigerium massiliense]
MTTHFRAARSLLALAGAGLMTGATLLGASPALAAPDQTAPVAVAGQAASTTVVRGYGRFTFNARLSHQGVRYHDPMVSDWAPATWSTNCRGKAVSFTSLRSLRASRVIQSVAPENADTEMILEFTSTAAAQRFMGELASAASRCDYSSAGAGVRQRYTSGRVTGAWTQGLAVRSWAQARTAGRWHNTPGADMQLFARKGNRVTMASVGGELVGDAWNDVVVRKTLLSRVTWSANRM